MTAYHYRIAYVLNGETRVETFDTLAELRQRELCLSVYSVPIVSITGSSLFVSASGELVERWKVLEMEFNLN